MNTTKTGPCFRCAVKIQLSSVALFCLQFSSISFIISCQMIYIIMPDFNWPALISIFFTIVIGLCSLFAYFHFNKRKQNPQTALSTTVEMNKEKTTNRKALKSHIVKKNNTGGLAAQVKQRVEKIELSKLTSIERENEMRVRANQLETILSLMRANPQKFGSVSSEDLTNQLSTFYTTATPTSFHVS
nr:hypothetical transcript [Hymenolepis microstoma]